MSKVFYTDFKKKEVVYVTDTSKQDEDVVEEIRLIRLKKEATKSAIKNVKVLFDEIIHARIDLTQAIILCPVSDNADDGVIAHHIGGKDLFNYKLTRDVLDRSIECLDRDGVLGV